MTLLSEFEASGHFPRFSIDVIHLGQGIGAGAGLPDTLTDFLSCNTLRTFLSYTFDSSITVPVDTFTFEFSMPDRQTSLQKFICEGSLVVLHADRYQLAKGIVDSIEVTTDENGGEKISVSGRDLMGQLEDQDCINAYNKPIYGENVPLSFAIDQLIANTRFKTTGVVYSNLPASASQPQLFATEVGERKLQALQRLLEGLNCIAWTNSDGQLVIGQPQMDTSSSAFFQNNNIVCSKARKKSNVTNIRAVRAAGQIPNSVLPIWVSQGLVQADIALAQLIYNNAPRPDELRRLGHIVTQTVTVSHPGAGGTSTALAETQTLINQGDLLTQYAKREIARRNVEELIVQCTVPGHFNQENNQPFVTDTIYHVDYEAHDVNEPMYLFHVQYYMDAKDGAYTRLWFTRLGTIVANGAAISVSLSDAAQAALNTA